MTAADPAARRSDPEPEALARRLVERVLDPMKRTFVGKDEIIDLLGIGLVATENLFLLGPPGTAKSAIVRELGRHIDGRTFEYLLTRFTEPNELFGPFDIRKLREGELVTNTEGMLPEASLVFLDELLHANSAILNSLLSVLNERTIRRGRETIELPLLMVVGASNRLPDDEALEALYDRFLLRVRCDNVSGERLEQVLEAGWKLDTNQSVPVTPGMTVSEVKQLSEFLPSIDLQSVRAPYLELVRRLRRAGIRISDRRAVKMQRLVAASALLCGRREAQPSDLWVFRFIWDSEDEQEILAAVVEELARSEDEDPARVHPRAQATSTPDPESMAAEIDELARRVSDATGSSSAGELSVLADRLAALAGRCQWVPSDEQRGVLTGRIEQLWKQLVPRQEHPARGDGG